jgi:hypothetical protein
MKDVGRTPAWAAVSGIDGALLFEEQVLPPILRRRVSPP